MTPNARHFNTRDTLVRLVKSPVPWLTLIAVAFALLLPVGFTLTGLAIFTVGVVVGFAAKDALATDGTSTD